MKRGHACPHCGSQMDPIRTPLESSWGGEVQHVCFNDECSYYVKSWNPLQEQGIEKTGYRSKMDPRGGCGPAPVWSKDALKDLVISRGSTRTGSLDYFGTDDLTRDDESPDCEFYRLPRFVDHLDATALETVESLYGRLIAQGATVLDLMAGPKSHLGGIGEHAHVVGLGLNGEELAANKALSEHGIHDLNAAPTLPFDDTRFDAVVNTVSVDYLTRPVEVFREVARVLKANGLFIVVFSNRMFPPKAVNIWKRSTEKQRVELVRKYFALSERFVIEGYFESIGKPRPQGDKYYALGIPSDPVYAVWGKAAKETENSPVDSASQSS